MQRPIMGYWYMHQADTMQKRGDQAGAADTYARAAERLPWQPLLWEKAGVAAWVSGDSQQAQELLVTANEKNSLSLLYLIRKQYRLLK